MSFGFEAFNALGQRTIGIDTEMWLIRSMISVGARTAGSVVVPNLSLVQYKIIIMPITDYRVYRLPVVSVSGNTLYWTDPGAGGVAANIIVLVNG